VAGSRLSKLASKIKELRVSQKPSQSQPRKSAKTICRSLAVTRPSLHSHFLQWHDVAREADAKQCPRYQEVRKMDNSDNDDSSGKNMETTCLLVWIKCGKRGVYCSVVATHLPGMRWSWTHPLTTHSCKGVFQQRKIDMANVIRPRFKWDKCTDDKNTAVVHWTILHIISRHTTYHMAAAVNSVLQGLHDFHVTCMNCWWGSPFCIL